MDKEKEEALSNGKNVIMDIPLLFENKLQNTVDETWLVYTNQETQILRLKERNQLSDEEAEARIQSQIPIDEKKTLADCIIDNNGTLNDLRHNINDLLKSKALNL
ncbi:MAG TPA: dephospho-CoA kinase, partial [Staphylococcus sp.]|nr:dephospho-CoA kinase [Staphylococcus sp.]